MRTRSLLRLTLLTFALGACSGDEEFVVTPLYNHANGRVVVELTRPLESGETLHVRARRGSFGQLDCATLAAEVAPLEDATGERIDGPLVEPALTKAFYDSPQWLDPTPEMLAQLEGGVDSIIDVCVMNGSKVVLRLERDLFQAWDQARTKGFGGKADEPSGEQSINSPQAYGERCVAELGEIPFFEKTGDGTYTTYDCLDSTPIPMTVTQADGTVRAPQEGTEPKCDAPQFIYSLCEAGPRVATRINDQGTRWVLLCRKSIGGYASDQYNDIAMIGSNPFTGKTCFFQNALYSKKDGGNVPHPADREKSQNLWAGVHGGVGSGIQCGSCHSTDAFIHSPWIDGAKDLNGRPIVPKMGVDPDYPLGANDTPYAIVNRRGQNWTMPKQLVSADANACLKCHRMADDRWSDEWLARLDGQDRSWTDLLTATGNLPQNKYWMPPDHSFATDEEWQGSASKQALDFIERCGQTPTLAGCNFKEVPETTDGSGTGGKLRNPVDLPDDELAKQATKIIGFNKTTPSQVCAECHSPNETTLRDWQEKTNTAVASCLAETGGGGGEAHDEDRTGITLARNEVETFGPFEVAEGSFFEVTMTGTGDADLHVKRGAEASTSVYDCRPYTDSSNETCNRSTYNAAGPAQFWIAVNGYSAATVALNIKYTSPGGATMSAKDRVDCFRLEDRNDAPFTPAKLGIYAAGAHLGWFQDTFKQAFPAGEGGNTTDTWAIEYGKFKNRVSMPKGNHPRFSQGEFDIVAEWFARGLPRLTTYIAPDTGPTSCTPSISSQVSTHVSQMATQGWSAVNRQAGINMYGCGGSADPRSCLTSLPTAQSKSYGTGWTTVGTLRILRELSFNTYYWMRSSPDGRFVANGSTGSDSVISDLQANKDIAVDGAYDPGFFPDNRGWVFQGTPIDAAFCQMSLLQSTPDRIDFSESACSSVASVGLYQHLGAGLGGADYFAINSQFTSDNPEPEDHVTTDPHTGFAQGAQIKLTPMVFDGQHYVGKPAVSTPSPYEGDSVLSPSTRLVISRFGNQQNQLGYVLRKLTATPSGGSYNVSTTEVGRYCTQGAKPSISFDEKYFVTHHYVTSNDWQDLGFASANDPAFQAMLAQGTSNIIVVNLLTGARTRVTTMKAGQYALFPHFRSDGWFYFLVRDQSSGKEYAVASDAALALP